jgi:hypothetical protein
MLWEMMEEGLVLTCHVPCNLPHLSPSLVNPGLQEHCLL